MTPSVKHLVLIYDEAKEVLGEENFTWSVAAGGRFQIPITTTAIAMGAQNVRVGLEDSIYAGKGIMAKASADQVNNYGKSKCGSGEYDQTGRQRNEP